MLKTPKMITIEEIRRSKLRQLVTTYGGGKQSTLAGSIGVSPSQISQWINASPDSKTGKPRAMDSTTARRIESILGLAEGWMDSLHGVSENEAAHGFGPIDLSDLSSKTPLLAPVIDWANIERELFVNNSDLKENPHFPVPDASSTGCKWIVVDKDFPRFGIRSGNKIAVQILGQGLTPPEGEVYIYKNISGVFFLGEHRHTADGFEAVLDNGTVLDSTKHGITVIALHKGTWK